MAKKNVYEVEKNVERVLRGGYTGFLTLNVAKEVKNRLKKEDYHVFYSYLEAEKIILYTKKCPKVRLYKIECFQKEKLKHSEIMGSLFGLNIIGEMFGDIVLFENDFYIYLLDEIVTLVCDEFRMIGNLPVRLVEVDLELLSDYQRNYEKRELIVSSLRIDMVISRLLGWNRTKVQEKIQEKMILLNGEILKKSSYSLHDNDVFSIRGCGKYCFGGIVNVTKKNNYVILIKKYL